MTPPDRQRPRIDPVLPEQYAEALGLLIGPGDESLRQQHIDQLIGAAASGERSLAGLLAAWRGGRLVGVIWFERKPGKTATVSVPRRIEGEPAETAAALLGAAVGSLQRDAVTFAQAGLEIDAPQDAATFRAHGFEQIAELLYMVSNTSKLPRGFAEMGTGTSRHQPVGGRMSRGSEPVPISAKPPAHRPPGTLTFEPYEDRLRGRLVDIVRRSYVGTLDCPALEGLSDIEDVLDGYRATGDFDPGRWLLVARDGQDVGCLLLADHPRDQQWELVYMGVVPEHRGHGWGLRIVRHGQWLAAQADRERLVLAVDADNTPAIRMYAAAGFSGWDRRAIFLLTFGKR